MQNKRLRKYLLQKKSDKNELSKKQGSGSNSDKRTNQDFPGYPHSPSKEEMINPKTNDEKKVAALYTKDGEKVIDPPAKKKALNKEIDEIDSDGSANAFEGTENVRDDE